jgi:protease-4
MLRAMKNSARWVGLLLFVALLSGSASARAQTVTRGLRLPFPAVSLADDATGIDANPGGLGFVRGFEAAILATELPAGVPGTGQAGYFALPLPLGITLGLGFTHVGTQSRTAFPSLRFDDFARLSFAMAWSPSARFSIGLATHTMFADASQLSRLTTLDLGLTWRPSRWLSFGATVRDVTTPALGSGELLQGLSPAPGVPGTPNNPPIIITQPQTVPVGGLGGLAGLGSLSTTLRRQNQVNRAWVLGVGVRPGTERAFIGADVRIEEIARRVDPSVRVLFEPVPGLALGGSLEMRDRDGTTELTAQLGLTWAFDLASSYVRGSLGYSSWVERGRGHDGFSIAARLYGSRERALPEPRDRFVRIALEGAMPESAPPGGLFVGGRPPRWTHARALLALEAARRDERVSGVLLSFDDVGLGLAQAEELRSAILALRKAGKRVVTYLMGSSNASYLAASAGDALYVNPTTTINVVGFASSLVFLRGLLDKVGVLPEFIAVGKYKSAPEQLTRKSRSEPAREATQAFLNDAMARLVAGIAENRRRSHAEVRAMIDDAPFSADEAVRGRWADGVEHLEDLPKRLEKAWKRGIDWQWDAGAPAGNRWAGYDRIAIVHIEGTITDGKSSVDPLSRGRSAGAETIVEALREAKNDPRVRAVVLRVNSPGGSVTASERIWRAVRSLRKVKPVVASFGGVAASGGYYVAVGANEIFADETTLTGSIGVFFGKASAKGLFAKGDVHDDTLKTARHADLLSIARPWTDGERAHLERLVLAVYDQFVARVVEGRKLARDHVLAAAQGRIWSGRAALARRLVDRFGTLADAVTRAKVLAGIRPDARVGIVQWPQPGFWQRVLSRIGVDSEDAASKAVARVGDAARALLPGLGAVSPWLVHLRSGEPWALLPLEIDLR